MNHIQRRSDRHSSPILPQEVSNCRLQLLHIRVNHALDSQCPSSIHIICLIIDKEYMLSRKPNLLQDKCIERSIWFSQPRLSRDETLLEQISIHTIISCSQVSE